MSNALVEEVKKKAGITCDYTLAKAIGVSPELVSRWNLKKSEPNGINALKLAQLGKMEAKRAIELMEGGYSELALLIVLASSGLLLLNIDLMAFISSIDCILCKISRHSRNQMTSVFQLR